ncbi:hypothetical protein LTR85_005187 [Meristemomyces frigidus]|nr:hypothetical protein LTR85_005187 [Meristemomyces frigidus]
MQICGSKQTPSLPTASTKPAPVITKLKDALMVIRNLGNPPEGWTIHLQDANDRRLDLDAIYYVCVGHLNLRFGKAVQLCEQNGCQLVGSGTDKAILTFVNGVLQALEAGEVDGSYVANIIQTHVIDAFNKLKKLPVQLDVKVTSTGEMRQAYVHPDPEYTAVTALLSGRTPETPTEISVANAGEDNYDRLGRMGLWYPWQAAQVEYALFSETYSRLVAELEEEGYRVVSCSSSAYLAVANDFMKALEAAPRRVSLLQSEEIVGMLGNFMEATEGEVTFEVTRRGVGETAVYS